MTSLHMLRAPFWLAKMSYDAATDTVIYRSKGDWSTRAAPHIPDHDPEY